MWLKICANTNLHDAALAAELGADAVGFVFAPSKRQVSVAQVAAITPELPGSVEKIGVFSGWNAAQIVEAVEVSGLTGVQLHGAPDPALLAELNEAFEGRVKLIQVLGVEAQNDPAAQHTFEDRLNLALQQPALWAVLLDTSKSGASGGLGIPFDWDAAASRMQRGYANAGPEAPRLIVAGGLRAANVRKAIAALQPFGVDVASGVEAEPGRKDPQALRAFLDATRESHTV